VTTDEATDARLVEGARSGDIAAMGALLERYRPSLIAHALTILGYRSPGDSEDIVQETFLAALAKLHQLEEPAAFRGWLHAIHRNNCLQHLRRLKARPVEPLADTLAGPADPAAGEPGATLRDEVWTAIDTLPADLQATVILRHFSSRTAYESIAATLGVPVGTVRSRLHDARHRLARSLRLAAEGDAGGGFAAGRRKARILREALSAFYVERDRRFFGLVEDDAAIALIDQPVRHGRGILERDFTDDVAAGVRLAVHDAFGSDTVTVLEGQLRSPEDDPFHCPANAAMVVFYGPSAIRAVRLHGSPEQPAAR